MIKFVHTADIHYGMENYGKIDAKTGIHTRLLDFDYAFNACITRAIKENVDFFLFCGDAYKTANPSPTQQRLLFKALLRLQQARIPIILVVGNHDNPLTFGKAHALEILADIPLEGFHVIEQPKIISLETKNGPINIVGIPWPTRNSIALNKNLYLPAYELTSYISKALSTIIQQLANQLDPTIPAVLAGHLTVSNGLFSGSEKRAVYGNDPILLPSQLAITPFDYVALGHLHRHQNLNKDGIPVVYAGSIERIDFGERKEDKGFCLVNIPAKGMANYEFCTSPMRPFIQIEVQIHSDDDQTKKIIEAIKKHPIEKTILKIVYYLPADTSDRVDISAVQKSCASAHFIVAITPIKTFSIRERRKVLNINMDIKTLLENYFSTKPELSTIQNQLVEKALECVQKADQEAEDNEN